MTEQVRQASGAEAADGVRTPIWRSVKPDNIGELMAAPDIDGALVGGASLDPNDFSRIVSYRLR